MRRGHLFGIRRAVEGLDHLIQERHVNRLREVEDSFHDAATGTVPYLASPPNCLTGCESLIAGGILRLLLRRCASPFTFRERDFRPKTKKFKSTEPRDHPSKPFLQYIYTFQVCTCFRRNLWCFGEVTQIIYNYLGSVATCRLLTLPGAVALVSFQTRWSGGHHAKVRQIPMA